MCGSASAARRLLGSEASLMLVARREPRRQAQKVRARAGPKKKEDLEVCRGVGGGAVELPRPWLGLLYSGLNRLSLSPVRVFFDPEELRTSYRHRLWVKSGKLLKFRAGSDVWFRICSSSAFRKRGESHARGEAKTRASSTESTCARARREKFSKFAGAWSAEL